MVIDMLVQPMLYSEICTPGDEPDGFGFWSREFGMGHMGPMDWDELQVEMDVCDVRKSVLMPLDVTTACGGHFAPMTRLPCWLPRTPIVCGDLRA